MWLRGCDFDCGCGCGCVGGWLQLLVALCLTVPRRTQVSPDDVNQEEAEEGAQETPEQKASEAPKLPLRHQYSEATLVTVLDMMESLASSPRLRLLMKGDTQNYLHLRGLASGVIKGLTRYQQRMAQMALAQFAVDDTVDKALGRIQAASGVAASRDRSGSRELLRCKRAVSVAGSDGGLWQQPLPAEREQSWWGASARWRQPQARPPGAEV